MTIQIDSREKKKAIEQIKATFEKCSITYFVSKLPVGDYISLDNARISVDRKQNLLELCNNVCQDHKRFTDELKRAQKYGIQLVFLIEHSKEIKRLEDVRKWENPRLKKSPMAVSGERLYKILSTMEKTYNTRFYFCSKAETGQRIIELLNDTK
ncbi:MAG: ERCC4 domain-containing protein [Oscillospiraceae bacterium]|nr:ERCC4 domain-containing protein [Oscillospiraceae bacterium]